MGAVGGLLGMKGGAGGSGFGTNAGVDPSQINTAYQGVQGALGNQGNLLTALQGQNGLQNQSNVYNQLQGVVSGQGPNPAQTMLNQATGANVANQAALMAGQRGAGANAGLMARQAAQTGAGLQQQAAGQGATMQAQQALGALGQAGQMAGSMAANQIGQTNANAASQLQEQNNLLDVNKSNNANQTSMANSTMQGQQGLIGGAMNAAGAMFGMASGGDVPSAFTPQSMFGNFLANPSQAPAPSPMGSSAGADSINKGMTSLGKGIHAYATGDTESNAENEWAALAPGGEVKAMVSPGEKVLTPDEARAVAKGKANPMKVGGQVPGSPKVKGDSYKNDTVPAKLPVHGVVIPNSIMQGKDPARGAAEFVRDVLSKKRTK